jgi:predicted nucleic acid-binding protein
VAVALDSGVIAGFLDRADSLHEAADCAIREIAAQNPIVVSVITYAEILTGAKIGHHRPRDVEGFFDEVVSRTIPVSVAIATRAAELRARTRALRMPDALILATAETDSETTELLSADRNLAKVRSRRCRIRRLDS